jgi:hypothetical protein
VVPPGNIFEGELEDAIASGKPSWETLLFFGCLNDTEATNETEHEIK